MRLAGAIALAALAFIVWNVGTRSPLALARDVRRAIRSPRGIFLGLISFAIGLIFVVAALVLVLPAIVDFETDLWLTLVLMFLVALAIELLIGPDVRRLATRDDNTTA